VLGTIGYAVATGRAATFARWVPIAFALGTAAGIVINPGGAIVLGALWLALATTILGERYELRPATA
jgi:hypothetical protein